MRKRIGFNTVMVLSLLLGAIPGRALAAEQEKKAEKPIKRFGLAITIDATTNLFEPGDVDHAADAKLWLAPSYKITDKLSLSGLFITQKDLTGLEETHLVKSSLTVRHKGRALNPYITVSPAFNVALPLTHNAIARESLILGTSIAPRFNFSLAPIGAGNISGFFDVSLSKNFHQYETQTTGGSNSQWKLTNWLVVEYGFLTDFALQLSLIRSTSWTYQGHARNIFDFNQELSYSIGGGISLAVGHNNSGDVLAANGTDSNIGLYDERSSTVYTALSFSL